MGRTNQFLESILLLALVKWKGGHQLLVIKPQRIYPVWDSNLAPLYWVQRSAQRCCLESWMKHTFSEQIEIAMFDDADAELFFCNLARRWPWTWHHLTKIPKCRMFTRYFLPLNKLLTPRKNTTHHSGCVKWRVPFWNSLLVLLWITTPLFLRFTVVQGACMSPEKVSWQYVYDGQTDRKTTSL